MNKRECELCYHPGYPCWSAQGTQTPDRWLCGLCKISEGFCHKCGHNNPQSETHDLCPSCEEWEEEEREIWYGQFDMTWEVSNEPIFTEEELRLEGYLIF